MSQQSTRVSRASQASVRSAGSRHSYKTVSHHSAVDESLFGESFREKKLRENRETRSKSESPKDLVKSPPSLHSPGSLAPTQGRQKPEVVQVITKDLIRKIRIPRPEDPSGTTIILGKGHLDRIVSQAAVVTKDDLEGENEQRETKRNELQVQVQKRKKEFQAIERARRTNEKSDLDKEAEDTRGMLIQRSKNMMEEQDDEIKKLNEVMLNAKCHAIRDAQLSEKDMLKTDMDGEEKRLDTMMEVDRLKALQEYERREQERHRQRLLGAQVIQLQIKDREQDRLLESEKKDQETRAMLEYLERLQIEDIKEMGEKVTRQKKLMGEINVANDDIQRQKLLQREQEKLAEMKVLEYIKEKESREEAFQKESERQAAEKEKEIARLRQQQERAKDVQAEKDVLRAKRNQEQFERDWRKKQKELMEKKADNDRMLKEARQQQIRDKEHFLSLQAQRDRAEFERVLQVQQQVQQKDQDLSKAHTFKNKAYSEQVRKQVKSKEEDRLNARREFFEEGIKLGQEAKERRQKLDEIKMRKLQELKDAGIPSKYTAEVSRRIHAPHPVSFTMS